MPFVIKSESNGMALGVKDAQKSGAEVILWPYHGGDNQKWEYKDMIYSKLNGYVSCCNLISPSSSMHSSGGHIFRACFYFLLIPWKTEMGHPYPMSQYFNIFMRLNSDSCFMLRVFLNCVYLLYYATC
jgi:hypothetical protein